MDMGGEQGIPSATDSAARLRALLAVQYSIANIIAKAGELRDASTGILEAVCSNLDWELGQLWVVSEERRSLEFVASWRRGPRSERFEHHSAQRSFERGVGLPGRVWESAEPVWIGDVSQDVNFPRAPLAEHEGLHGAFAFPITLREEVLGVMEFFSSEIRPLDAELLETMGSIGSQLGQFLERRYAEEEMRQSEARKSAALELEQRARAEAESANERLRALQSITDATLKTLSLDELVRELLTRVRHSLAVDVVVMTALTEDGKALRVRALSGEGDWVDTIGMMPESASGAEGDAPVIDEAAIRELPNPIFDSHNVSSVVGTSLVGEGGLIGVLQVGSVRMRRFTDDDVRLLELAADRVALAVERARRYEREHRIAETLQRSLLPERLPDIASVELAATYIPGGSGIQVGGDWYDVIPLSNGLVGLAIGDVSGRGIPAATTMGQLRNALRAYALEDASPATTLERLNRLAESLETTDMATVIYMVFDPDRGELWLASAGHPPPLLLSPDGSARYLEEGRSLPLGAAPDTRFAEHRTTLPEGCTLLLYTDGLVERRGESLNEGLARLGAVLEGGPAPPQKACEDALSALFGHEEPHDDVAMLAIRPLPSATETLELELPAVAASVGAVRHELRRWLEGRADPDVVFDVCLASAEASANAIEHAYGPGDASFELIARWRDGEVEVVVRDSGTWRVPRRTERGRGLPMMESLMDDVEVAATSRGTEVTLRRSLDGAS